MSPAAVIGLIGGMSWESSAEYYRIINQTVRERLGGVHSARSLMASVDFGLIEDLQHHGRWDELGDICCEAALSLSRTEGLKPERGAEPALDFDATCCTGHAKGNGLDAEAHRARC